MPMLIYVDVNMKLQHFVIYTFYQGTWFELHSKSDGCSNSQVPSTRTCPW